MLHGIDVSAYQGAIDWRTVGASQKVGFVYARAFHSKKPSDFGDDRMFRVNHDECAHASIPFGVYFFYIAAQNGRQQADHLLYVAHGRFADLAPVVDVEENSGAQGWGDSVSERIANLQLCLEHLSASFCEPILYTNQDTWQSYFGGTTAFSKYRLWVADPHGPPGSPVHMPPGWHEWTIHQYGQGRIPGIGANVDLDCLRSADLDSIKAKTNSA